MRVVRTVAQVILAVLGWLLFAWLWWRAIVLGPTDIQLRGTIVVALIDAVIIVITALWIIWNKDIYRRKGPRKVVPAVEFTYDTDALGTAVDIRSATGSDTRFIVIDVRDEDSTRRKVFHAADAETAAGSI